MKKLMYISIIAIAAGFGCKKGFLSELQNNPNSPTTSAASVQLVLPGAINSLVNTISNASINNGYQYQAAWLGYWNYSGGYSFNTGAHEYIITNTTGQVWDSYYNVLTNLNVVVQQASASSTLSNYTDIANILEAICYKNLVDAYNDIPYSQSLKGASNFYPTYDKGSDVYDSLVAKLDIALDDINSNLSNAQVVAPGVDDILFGGDMSKWLQFGNTVKLKLLVQQSNVAAKQAYIKSEASKTNSYGYLNEDALVQPGYSSTQQNALYGAFGLSPSGSLNGSYDYIRGGGYAIDFLKNTNDPRLGFFYAVKGTDPSEAEYYQQSSSKDDYDGDYLGTQAISLTNGSGIGPGIAQDPGQPAVMMLAAESYFVQAEAVVRGYISGNAEDLYDNGIEASFSYLGVPNAASVASDYEAQETEYVAWPSGKDAQIAAIVTQKWIANDGINNLEGWNDWRRTGFPDVPATEDPNSLETHMPYRYYYPIQEPNTNADAWKAAGGDTVNPFTDKIFWM